MPPTHHSGRTLTLQLVIAVSRAVKYCIQHESTTHAIRMDPGMVNTAMELLRSVPRCRVTIRRPKSESPTLRCGHLLIVITHRATYRWFRRGCRMFNSPYFSLRDLPFYGYDEQRPHWQFGEHFRRTRHLSKRDSPWESPTGHIARRSTRDFYAC